MEADSILRSKELRRVAVVSVILAGLALCLGSAALEESRSRATVSSIGLQTIASTSAAAFYSIREFITLLVILSIHPIDVFHGQALTEVDDPLADLGVEPYTWKATHADGKLQMMCHS
jgi:hypothetical protein